MSAVAEKKSITREYFEALLVAVIFVNFAHLFVFRAFKIPSGSMEDNLKVGDHIVVNKFIYGPLVWSWMHLLPIRPIKRGDIIIFRYPKNPEVDYVKRVVGLPGETVEIRNRTVYIDGKPLNEPYVIHVDKMVYPREPKLIEPYRSRDQFDPYTVPDSSYFAMGDNRDLSEDSRYWGTVPRSMIEGRAFMVYWSFRGHPPPPTAPASARVRELTDVFVHFFSNTRWDRCGFIVDSRYHYHPEEGDNSQGSFSE